MSSCPHADVRFCPLYVACHMGGGFGCDDGHLHNGTCAVDRGRDYAEMVGRLSAAHPQLVAELRFEEEAEAAVRQRTRNMRLSGVH